MDKKQKRKFRPRDIVLVCILIVVAFIGLYFGAVYYPISSRSATLETQLEDAQLQIEVAKGLKADYDSMKAELERIEESGDDTVMPQYNNNKQQEVLVACFTRIFEGMPVDISYRMQGTPADGVRTRTVSFSFTVNEAYTAEGQTVYAKTRSLLHALMTTGYRCSMSSLSLSPADGVLPDAASIRVGCEINFYELG